jgi:hypothetical protein
MFPQCNIQNVMQAPSNGLTAIITMYNHPHSVMSKLSCFHKLSNSSTTSGELYIECVGGMRKVCGEKGACQYH